ncbi:MAG: hypothetical protein AB7G15_02090 [Alphaproteobacteria bacterium]
MRNAALYSFGLHVIVGALFAFGLPEFRVPPEMLTQPIPVEVVNISERANPPPGKRDVVENKQPEADQPEAKSATPPKAVPEQTKQPQVEPRPDLARVPEPEKKPQPNRPPERDMAALLPPPTPEPKPRTKVKPEPKPEPEPEKVEQPKPEPEKPRAEVKPDPKPEPEKPRTEVKPDPKPEPKPEKARAEVKPVAKPEPPKPEPPKPDPKAKQQVDFDKMMRDLTKTKQQASVDNQKDKSSQNEKRGAPDNRPRDPLSMTEMDAIRRQLAQCWNPPTGAKSARDLVVDIDVDLNPDGTVRTTRIVDEARARRDDVFRAAAESARRAFFNARCTPLKLPAGKYNTWKAITVRFDPKDIL